LQLHELMLTDQQWGGVMVNRKAASSGLNPRKNMERRCVEDRPPKGCCERRKKAERRLPIVLEDAVSEAEWFRYMAVFIARLRADRLAQLEMILGLSPSQLEGN